MKDIKGYEGLYAITSCGEVWSYKSKKFLKQEKKDNGYLRVNLYKNKTSKHYYTPKLVAQADVPNLENKLYVKHKDGNLLNNSFQNLEWSDREEIINKFELSFSVFGVFFKKECLWIGYSSNIEKYLNSIEILEYYEKEIQKENPNIKRLAFELFYSKHYKECEIIIFERGLAAQEVLNSKKNYIDKLKPLFN